MHDKAAPPPRGDSAIFYGWWMVALAFLVMAGGYGTQYITGVFLQPFVEKYHASNAAVLFSTSSITMLMLAISTPFWGSLVKRFRMRVFMSLAVALVSLGYALLALASALWQVTLIHGLLLASGMAISILAGNTLVSNWFAAKRGRALGISLAGISAAGFVVPPAATYAIAHLGLTQACFLIAVVMLAIIPVVYAKVVDTPEMKGLHVDGGVPAHAEHIPASDSPRATLTWRDLITDSRLWRIIVVCCVCTGVAGIILVTLIPIAQSFGIARQTASFLISVTAASAMAGKILFGVVFDRVNQRMIVRIPALLLIVTCALLLWQKDLYLTALGCVFLGLGLGAATILPGVLIGLNVGRGDFALAYSLVSPFFTVSVAAGLPLFGRVYDQYGNYEPALQLFLCALVFVLLFAQLFPVLGAAERRDAGSAAPASCPRQ